MLEKRSELSRIYSSAISLRIELNLIKCIFALGKISGKSSVICRLLEVTIIVFSLPRFSFYQTDLFKA